ncbi:shieldin complex subunit 3 [Alosa alosa]|uniref:shieldin complex subunit 3 n=1 Tax=Alosa alosa TaxID=278164 RepID=UPI0020150EC4|nr:shieldin complex subunit 3 [Alosa alosa]
MDVVLHYKKNGPNDMVTFAERALEDFPRRVLPTFRPWFPTHEDQYLPIRPLKRAPIVLAEDLKGLLLHQPSPEPLVSFTEPQPISLCRGNTCLTEKPQVTLLECADDCDYVKTSEENENTTKRFRRSWSVFASGAKFSENTQTLSKQFQKLIERHGLELRQRAKWIIGEVNCGPRHIESVWAKITRAVRQSKLPTCNANFQRNISQIWVFCDVIYGEYIGNFLKKEFHLNGQLSFAVHKHGNIFSC